MTLETIQLIRRLRAEGAGDRQRQRTRRGALLAAELGLATGALIAWLVMR